MITPVGAGGSARLLEQRPGLVAPMDVIVPADAPADATSIDAPLVDVGSTPSFQISLSAITVTVVRLGANRPRGRVGEARHARHMDLDGAEFKRLRDEQKSHEPPAPAPELLAFVSARLCLLSRPQREHRASSPPPFWRPQRHLNYLTTPTVTRTSTSFA
jgi:hypothetical protein